MNNHENKSESPFSLMNPVVELRVLEMTEMFQDNAKTFIEIFSRQIGYDNFHKVRVVEGLLFHASKCINDDLEKFKFYSGSSEVEEPKRAAYFLKWISKTQPLQIPSSIFEKSKAEEIWKEERVIKSNILQINNEFAFYNAIACFKSFPPEFRKTDEYMNFKRDVLYNLTFRQTSGRQFTTSFKLFQLIFEKF